MSEHTTDSRTPGNVSSLYTLLVFVSIVLVLLVVSLSAYLRLSGSGLGCADWPSCYALIKIETGGAESLAAAHLIPPWATLTHRLVASVLGLLVLGITFMAWRRESGLSFVIPLAVLSLTVFLSVLGYITPSPLLPWVTLSNLLGGMAMLAMLWWLGQRSVIPKNEKMNVVDHTLRPWAWVGLGIVFLQIALGGWVSANFAALSCTDLPGCGGYPWTGGPWRESFNLFRELPVTDGGAVIAGDAGKIIHLAHRAGAVFIFLYLGWLGWRAVALGGRYRGTGIAVLVFLAFQILLGAVAVAYSLPLGLVTAHNALAALLMLAIVNLNHLLTPRMTK